MNEELYRYLVENHFFTHGIGEINEGETFFKFESIIKNGGLMSMEQLKEKGIDVSGKVSGIRSVSENKICMFDPSIPEIKNRLLSKHYYYYLPFHPNVIFFIIDGTNIKVKQYPNANFEVIEETGFISIDNFKGIIAPSECTEYLYSIQKKYGINLPIYDFDFNITNVNNENETNINRLRAI